jgi:hypothetical protein
MPGNPSYLPNMQNNYFYSFNSTFVPHSAAGATQVGTDVSMGPSNITTREVKSIEIQVSPERLVEGNQQKEETK